MVKRQARALRRWAVSSVSTRRTIQLPIRPRSTKKGKVSKNQSKSLYLFSVRFCCSVWASFPILNSNRMCVRFLVKICIINYKQSSWRSIWSNQTLITKNRQKLLRGRHLRRKLLCNPQTVTTTMRMTMICLRFKCKRFHSWCAKKAATTKKNRNVQSQWLPKTLHSLKCSMTKSR